MITKADAQLFLADYSAFLGSSLRYFFASIQKHIFSFLLIVALATAGSFYWWYHKTPYYETNMVCSYNNDRLGRKSYGEILQKLNLLAQSKSYNELAKLLALPVKQTKTLISLDVTNMAGSPLYEDITGTNQPFYITVRATEKDIFTPLQPALISYLSNNTYLKDIGNIEVAKLNAKAGYARQNLIRVDSVIDAYTVFLRHTSVADTLGGFSNIQALFKYKDDLEEKVTSLQQRIALQAGPSVMVMHGFTPPDSPTKGDKKTIWIGVLMGLVVASGWAVFRNTMRNA